ncbi:SAM-dependent methyltransferase [Nocardiopsis sp. CNT-189]|uniref:SAM-dependent methyltransferase n=1 Tax=Nocardiopsis oceanisediminis TaxID=2816862 RepID=UPI003B302CAA
MSGDAAGAGGGRAAPGIDASVPHPARVWNHWLGGKDNYPVDRRVGDEVLRVNPGIVDIARHSREFLRRVVHHLAAEEGIRQFLDVGTGLPTADNTHEVAQRAAPEARVVYVDNDPLVLAHARALLVGSPEGATDYVDADARDPGRVLAEAARTLDFSRPVALIMIGIMGSITDDVTAHGVRDRLVGALPGGSHLVVSDGSNAVHPEQAARSERALAESGEPYRLRSPEELSRFFTGLELLDPGVVSVSRWRPPASPWGEPPEVDAFCGVARKP